MDIKITPVAREDFGVLNDADYRRVASVLHERLPTCAARDPKIELSELGTDVLVHRIEDGDFRVLYKLRDVDSDGEDEIVILRVLSKLDGFFSRSSTLTESDIPVEDLPRSARIGHELLTKIQQLGA